MGSYEMTEERTKDLFEGEPDARQGGADTIPTRFRPRYRKLTTDELALVDQIKEQAAVLERLIERTPGRYSSIAMTELELAIMMAVKAVTA